MKGGGNSFYYILFGAILVIAAFAVMNAVPAWREVLLGPPVKAELHQSTPQGDLLAAKPEENTQPAAPQTQPEEPKESPPVRREPKLEDDSGKPAGMFDKEETMHYGQQGREKELPWRGKVHGPHTTVDAIVYNRPNGEPLPAPNLTRTALTLLAGTQVKIGERRGDWIFVTSPAGYKGWVKVHDLDGLKKG